MYYLKYFSLILLFLIPFNINGQENYSLNIKDSSSFSKHNLISNADFWYFKDIYKDSVLGISLIKALNNYQHLKPKENITIALLDMPVDSDLLFSNSFLWSNSKEIPNNNIDDDLNGYIDDLNGWNFLGEISGNQQIFGKYDYTRILENNRDSSRIFSDQGLDSLINQSSIKEVKLAAIAYKSQLAFANKELAYAKMIERVLYESRYTLRNDLSLNYTLKELDSLKVQFSEDTLKSKALLRLHNFKKYGFDETYIRDYYFKSKGRLDYLLNPDYEDRRLVGDDKLASTQDTLINTIGNNVLNNAKNFLQHGVLMSNFISDQNKIKLKSLKIMPLVISSLGDEYDKDIYYAIKYAVDNGARVINMSFSKKFSTFPQLIQSAIRYANDHNVIIVTSAGNEGQNIDLEENKIFPNDEGFKVDNFIVVGSTNAQLDTRTISSFSNYGALNVDLYAPGEDIFILNSKREYETQSGTSVSTALVSKTIGLILSYFPELTAKEIKNILLNSVTKINGEIKFGDKSKPIKIGFENASQSGGILNAFKAFVLAQQLADSK